MVVSALISRPYVLDLHPDRSVVRQFLDRGFEVYLVDWGAPSPLDADLGLADDLDDPDAVARFSRCHRLGLDPVDVPGRLFREFVDDLYRDDALLAGTLTVGGRRVDVGAIDAPVLAVAGSEDRFVPPEAGRPFLDPVGSADVAFWEVPVDHVGLSVSARAHAGLWPRVCDWVAARSGDRTSGTVEGAPGRGETSSP